MVKCAASPTTFKHTRAPRTAFSVAIASADVRKSMRTVEIEPTFEGWQTAARLLLRDGVPPTDVRWRETAESAQPLLIAEASAPARGVVKVPRQFLDVARRAAAASDPARWQLLYETLWRVVHENHDLLADTRDPAIRRLSELAASPGIGSPEAAGAALFVPAGAGIAELRWPRRAAPAAISIVMRPRPSSASAPQGHGSSWSASSRATRKTSRARPSSARPARCWTARWPTSASSARAFTSPTR